MTVSRSRAGWIAKLLLLSGSLAITLVVLELGIRLFWGGYYLKAARAYAQPDALLGWGNRPNIRMQYGEPESVTTVEHNEWGFRGPAVAKQKPGDRYRILVLGDSFAYGVEADASMLLVVIPEQAQVQPDVRVTGLVVTNYEIQKQLKHFCDTAGIPMLDLLPALRASYARNGEPLYYHRDRHLKANGHALSASLILEKIRSLGFIS